MCDYLFCPICLSEYGLNDPDIIEKDLGDGNFVECCPNDNAELEYDPGDTWDDWLDEH